MFPTIPGMNVARDISRDLARRGFDNEHSASAAEMVVAFASENRLGDLDRSLDTWQARGDERVQGGLWLSRCSSSRGTLLGMERTLKDVDREERPTYVERGPGSSRQPEV